MLITEELSKDFRVKETRNLFSRAMPKIVKAVKNVNIKIEKGQIVGLLGINGAGKTTTIKMLSTMLEPTSGNLFIDDIDAVKNYKQVRSRLNVIVGGEKNLYWRLTAKENLEYFGSLYDIKKEILTERIKNLLQLVGLEDAKDLPVERYSKGMKQRLQIARGLINNPDYIFLDEPTLGLDITFAKEVRAYIKKLAKAENKGLLLTTHYIAEVDALCDTIYIINKGEIILEGTKEQIKKSIKHQNELFVTSIANLEEICSALEPEKNSLEISRVDGVANIFKIIDKNNNTNEIIKTLMDHNIAITEVKLAEASLEDAIFELLKGAS